MSLTFHFPSFLAGFLFALLLVALVYRQRRALSQLWQRLEAQVQAWRQQLTASIAERYAASVIEEAQISHLLGHLARLDQILIEPYLAELTPPVKPEAQNVFQFNGRHKQARFKSTDAVEAAERLVITGPLGSGRTMLLNHLLLHQCGLLLQDYDDEYVPLSAYLPALPPLDAPTGPAPEQDAETEVGQTDEEVVDVLVEAAAMRMASLVSAGAERWLRKQVQEGLGLILLDGWDELPPDRRERVTAWIRRLAQVHPDNRIVVAAGEVGYGPLVEAGFIPLTLQPWDRPQFETLGQRWTQAWPWEGRPHPEPPAIHYRATPPTPLFATLEVAIQLQGKALGRTEAECMEQALEVLVPVPPVDEDGEPAWPQPTAHEALNRLALSSFEDGLFLEREQIQNTVTDAMPAPQFSRDMMLAAKKATPSADELDEDEEWESAEPQLDKEEQKAIAEEEDRRLLQVVDCCRALTQPGGPIQNWADRGYLFAHPVVAAYFAARHLANTDQSAVVAEHADDPSWRQVCRFYVAMAPAEPLLERLMSVPDDLFLSRLWIAASWLSATPPHPTPWRGQLMKRLAQLFMNPQFPPLLRQRALINLVESGDPNIALLFKQAIQQGDLQARALSVYGLGLLGREQDLAQIESVLEGADPLVQLAAVESLKNHGGQKALEILVSIMLVSEDQVQRRAAEVLARFGEDGYAVLREAAEDDDLVIRRAAVYGLAAVDQDWAWDIVEKLFHDKEWFVRNAAEALLTAHEAKPELDLSLPKPEDESWLISWAAARGEGVGTGDMAIKALMRAAQDEDPEMRWMAVNSLRRLLSRRSVDLLRQGLRDPEPLVRQTAFSALEEISRRHNLLIPAT